MTARGRTRKFGHRASVPYPTAARIHLVNPKVTLAIIHNGHSNRSLNVASRDFDAAASTAESDRVAVEVDHVGFCHAPQVLCTRSVARAGKMNSSRQSPARDKSRRCLPIRQNIVRLSTVRTPVLAQPATARP